MFSFLEKLFNRPVSTQKLMKKADKGNKDAMVKFVTRHYLSEDDVYVKATELKAKEYISKLTLGEHSAGYIWLADMILKSETRTEKDVLTAMKLYKKAGDEGDEFGYECLGQMYFEGKDIPADYEKAFKCFSKLENTSPGSQYMLGEMYRQGLYVDKDMDKARACYDETIRLDEETFEQCGFWDDFYDRAKARVHQYWEIKAVE